MVRVCASVHLCEIVQNCLVKVGAKQYNNLPASLKYLEQSKFSDPPLEPNASPTLTVSLTLTLTLTLSVIFSFYCFFKLLSGEVMQ